MEDRKKRLEEIRKKKAEMERLLKEENAKNPSKPLINPAQAPAKESQPQSASQPAVNPAKAIPKKATARKSFFEDPSKNSVLMGIHIKKINASLREEHFENNCQGIYPSVKSEGSQYELPKEFQLDNKEENSKVSDKKQNISNVARRASIKQINPVSKFNIKKDIEENMHNFQKVFTEEKKNQVLRMIEPKFTNFYNKQMNVIDEALFANDIFDICTTYYNEDESNLDMSKRTLANHICELGDENSEGRAVVALDWSHKQDIFLASFSDTDDFNKQSGLIQLWSLENRKDPDYVINYQTQLTSALFHPYNPKNLIAGSYTGQILMWDIKSKPVPIQKSLITGVKENSHNHPINCLAILGGEGSAKLVSISTDGVLCEWYMNDLSKPVNRFELKKPQNPEQKELKEQLQELGTLCIGYNPRLPKNVIIGSDDKDIYQISLDNKDEKNHIINCFKGNESFVFSVDLHPSIADFNHNDLFLSASGDWTAKLWSTNSPGKPLLTFDENFDYIYSAKWHPVNPSIFVTVDGTGSVDFWDLNKDKDMPYYRYNLRKPLNKAAWSVDGRKLAVGDCNGRINVFASEKEVYNVKKENIEKFDRFIYSLKENIN